MRAKRYLLILWYFIILCWLPAGAQPTFPVNGPHDVRPGYYAFTHATVYVDAKTVLHDATLVIKDGKVEAAGNKISIPKEAAVIDLKGKYIYPSFIDLFSNYGAAPAKVQAERERGQQFLSGKKGAYDWNEAIRAEVNAADVFVYDEKRSKQYLESGFGIVLSQVQDGICRGTAGLILAGEGNENELIIKPQAAAAFSFSKGSSTQDYPSSLMGSIALLRQTYYDAKWYRTQDKEQNLSLAAFNHLESLPAIFETDNKLSLLRADKIGDEFGITYIIKGAGDEYQRLEEVKNAKAPLVIPLNFPKPYDVEDPFDAEQVSLTDMKHWEMAPANPALVSSAGITFAITSAGCNDAQEFRKNLGKAIQHGLKEEAALASLTTIPAQLLKVDGGTLRKGSMANFFICTKNYFSKDAQVLEHWVRGKKNFIRAETRTDLRGMYRLILNGYEGYRLRVDGELDKPQFALIGKDTLKADWTQQNEIGTLSFKTSKTSGDVVRIVAWADSLGNEMPAQVLRISGKAQMPDGRLEFFIAQYADTVRRKAARPDSLPGISHGDIIYPFTDYGWKKQPAQEHIVFRNVSVWTNERDGVLQETDVAVSNGKIAAVGKNIPAKGAREINGTGMHLTSGIIDEHSHIAIYRGVNEGTQPVTSEVRIGDVVNSEDVNIYRQLAGGVTASQLLHGSANPIGGQSALVKLRWGLPPEKMKIEHAGGFIKFALGENVKQSNWGDRAVTRYPQTRMGVEQVYYDAFLRAREYEQQPVKSRRRDLELDALVEILEQKRFITCHSYVQSEINMLLHVADSMKFRVNTFTHVLEGYKVADKLKAHGAYASTFADWWAYKYEVMEAIPYNAALMTKVGLTVAINSDDAEMGRRLNQEAAKTVKYGGMTEEQAWKMVTLNPAKMLHLDHRMGSIKVGKDADLVLWTGNPLSIYSKPEMTMVDGAVYFSREQDEAGRAYIRSERQRLIRKMILAKQAGEKTEKRASVREEDYHCGD
jgi:imidazolonepropionase-like amidohydrolase